MDLRLLKTFTAVVDAGTISLAADELMISQPALTRQIQQLERQAGVQLFLRHKGRLDLSPAGHKFVDAARSVLSSAEAAKALADSLAAGRITRLRMVAPTTTLTDVLAPFLAEAPPDDPLITVEEATYPAALAGLMSGIDLAILTAPPPHRLRTMRVAVLPLWAYVHSNHRLALSDEVSVTELARHRLITLDGTARARQLLDESLVQAGVSAPEIIECRNPHVAQALAAADRGVAVLSDDSRFGLHGLRVTTPRGPLTLTLHAGWDPRHHAAEELKRLVERLASFCSHRYGDVGDAPPAGHADE
jgi:DNA-binding transcriptional LysR family regulator